MPALVAVPGLGLDAEAWRPTLRALAAMAPWCSTRVVPLEGYGVSAGPAARLDPPTLARRLIDGLVERSVVLAGHSASCQVVAHAARLAPDRVAGLFLVGPMTDARAQGWPRLLVRWAANARHERPGQLPSLVRQYARTRPATMMRAMDAARHDRIDLTLAEVTCPVRIVRGRHDRLCPRSWAESLGPTVTVEGGAHMVPLTHGGLVAKQLLPFLSRVC